MKIGIWGTDEKCYNSLNFFLDSIANALNSLGVETEKFEVLGEDVLYAGYDAIIAINTSYPTLKLENGTYILDYFKCPYFMIYVDPPYYHHVALKEHINNLHTIFLDRGHVEYCKKYYGPFKSVQMGYMLGPVGKQIPYGEKKIDVLFTGSLYDENEFRNKVRTVWDADWAVTLYDLLVKYELENTDVSIESALEVILKTNNIQYDNELFGSFMNVIGTCAEYFLRGYYRRQIIKRLVDSGITVHIAGNGWEKLYEKCPSNLVLLGSVDFEKTAELMANSKIVLNVMPWFKDGLHDRIPTTMWNGSICVTDTSKYIEEKFVNEGELITFSLKEIDRLPCVLKMLLKDTERANQIAKAGRKKVEEYSWKRMVEECILKYL